MSLVEELRDVITNGHEDCWVTLSRTELKELLALIDANESQALERERLTQGF